MLCSLDFMIFPIFQKIKNASEYDIVMDSAIAINSREPKTCKNGYFCFFTISIHYSLCKFLSYANISITYVLFRRFYCPMFVFVFRYASFMFNIYSAVLFSVFPIKIFWTNGTVCCLFTISHVNNNLQWSFFIRLTFICEHEIFIPFSG